MSGEQDPRQHSAGGYFTCAREFQACTVTTTPDSSNLPDEPLHFGQRVNLCRRPLHRSYLTPASGSDLCFPALQILLTTIADFRRSGSPCLSVASSPSSFLGKGGHKLAARQPTPFLVFIFGQWLARLGFASHLPTLLEVRCSVLLEPFCFSNLGAVCIRKASVLSDSGL